MNLSESHREALRRLEAQWNGGDHLTPKQLQEALDHWRAALNRPATPGEECLDIVHKDDAPTGLSAPRWFCHLTGLRHRVVHILLQTPQKWFMLQKRARTKADWPGLFDTSAAGHLKAGQSWQEAASQELAEELGITATGLTPEGLTPVGGPYLRREALETPKFFRNWQVNRLYHGTLTAQGLSELTFADGEVDAILLCPRSELEQLLKEPERCSPGLLRDMQHHRAHTQQSH